MQKGTDIETHNTTHTIYFIKQILILNLHNRPAEEFRKKRKRKKGKTNESSSRRKGKSQKKKEKRKSQRKSNYHNFSIN